MILFTSHQSWDQGCAETPRVKTWLHTLIMGAGRCGNMSCCCVFFSAVSSILDNKIEGTKQRLQRQRHAVQRDCSLDLRLRSVVKWLPRYFSIAFENHDFHFHRFSSFFCQEYLKIWTTGIFWICCKATASNIDPSPGAVFVWDENMFEDRCSLFIFLSWCWVGWLGYMLNMNDTIHDVYIAHVSFFRLSHQGWYMSYTWVLAARIWSLEAYSHLHLGAVPFRWWKVKFCLVVRSGDILSW